jgi:hypothetical protein
VSLESLIEGYIAGLGADLILEQAQAVSVVLMTLMPVWPIVSSIVHETAGLLARHRLIAPPRRFRLAAGCGIKRTYRDASALHHFASSPVLNPTRPYGVLLRPDRPHGSSPALSLEMVDVIRRGCRVRAIVAWLG